MCFQWILPVLTGIALVLMLLVVIFSRIKIKNQIDRFDPPTRYKWFVVNPSPKEVKFLIDADAVSTTSPSAPVLTLPPNTQTGIIFVASNVQTIGENNSVVIQPIVDKDRKKVSTDMPATPIEDITIIPIRTDPFTITWDYQVPKGHKVYVFDPSDLHVEPYWPPTLAIAFTDRGKVEGASWQIMDMMITDGNRFNTYNLHMGKFARKKGKDGWDNKMSGILLPPYVRVSNLTPNRIFWDFNTDGNTPNTEFIESREILNKNMRTGNTSVKEKLVGEVLYQSLLLTAGVLSLGGATYYTIRGPPDLARVAPYVSEEEIVEYGIAMV